MQDLICALVQPLKSLGCFQALLHLLILQYFFTQLQNLIFHFTKLCLRNLRSNAGRLTSNPEPLPLKIRLAIHPAARPMSKYHKKYICFLILVDNQDNTNSVPGRMNGPEIIRGMR